MNRDAWQARLRQLPAWDELLLAESGLPGPRGNLELMAAVAAEGDEATFHRYAAIDAMAAPTNTPGEFLACCGVLGLGRLLAEGREDLLPGLRDHASDVRWRVREAVAMALQTLGDTDMERLLRVARDWSTGMPLEQRAAAAAVCEPRLLRRADDARATIAILDAITATIPARAERRDVGFLALRKGLGYAWSVAAAALPAEGLPAMDRWLASRDDDIRWIMRQNLGKARLVRADAAWVQRARVALDS